MTGSSAVDDKSEEALDSRNLFYARLGNVKVPRIKKAFDSRNLLPSTALDPNNKLCIPCEINYHFHIQYRYDNYSVLISL